MLQVKLPLVDRIYPQNNKSTAGGENEATGDWKLNDSPEGHIALCHNIHGLWFWTVRCMVIPDKRSLKEWKKLVEESISDHPLEH